MPRAKLIFAVGVLMLFAQFRCVAACAGDLCTADRSSGTESVPPCHKHHDDDSRDQSRDSCSFHRIISSATSPDAQHFEGPVLLVLGPAPAELAAILPSDAGTWISDFSDTSPPVAADSSLHILRI